MSVLARRRTGFACAFLVVSWAREAAAYRPFDGTDADVVAPGEVELEVSPAGYRSEGPSRFIVAPALVANYGFAPGFEAVLEGRQDIRLDVTPRSRVEDVAFSVKSLLRKGSRQGLTGVSVAVETGPLLPGSERRFGAHLASIFSLQSPALAVHLNLGNDLLCSLQYEAKVSLIVEGPDRWRIRPVVELLADREFRHRRFAYGLTESALLGAIGRLSDALSVDAALRLGHADSGRVLEARVGFTWGFPTL